MSKVDRILIATLFAFMLFTIYQDSPLSLWLGAAGRSFLTVTSLVGSLFVLFSDWKLLVDKYLWTILGLGIFLCCISIFSLAVWILLGNDSVYIQENLWVKSIKVLLIYGAYVAYSILILFLLRRVGIEWIHRFAVVILVLLAAIGVVEKLTLPNAFQFLHFSGVLTYSRIRLLTMESSTTGMLILVFSVLAINYCYQNRYWILLAVSGISTGILVALTSSKGLMVIIAFTILYLLKEALITWCPTHYRRRLIPVTLAFGLLVGIICCVFMGRTFIDKIHMELYTYTSVSTRVYTSLIGILMGIILPLGCGGGLFLVIYQNLLQNFLPQVIFAFPDINFSEVIMLAFQDTDIALTIKSGILQYHAYWGIVGTVILLRWFLRIRKDFLQTDYPGKKIYSFIFLMALLLELGSLDFCFEFWLYVVFLIAVIEMQEEKEVADLQEESWDQGYWKPVEIINLEDDLEDEDYVD